MHIEDGRFRMWTGRRRIGSWDEDAVKVERHTIFRFRIHVEGEIYEFIPDDPTEFAAHMKVVVDLTDQVRPRFGLAARLRDTASEA